MTCSVMSKKEDIQKFVDEDINPALESHGGWLEIKSFDRETKVLEISMGGGCQGCASAGITLRGQIERMLLEEFPEIESLKDITDHAAGENPFYQGDE